MGMKDFLITLTLISIFSVAILSFAGQFAVDNSAATNINNDDFLGNLSNDLTNDGFNNFKVANESGKGFEGSSIAEESESGTLVTGSAFKDALKLPTAGVYKILRAGFSVIGGDGNSGFAAVVTMIITLISIIGVLYIWKVWKGGNPD